MFLQEAISLDSRKQHLDKEQILTVEKSLQELESLCQNFLLKKEKEINIFAKNLLTANRQERINIYNRIFSFSGLHKIIKEYEAFIHVAANKQISFDCHLTVRGLNYTEELVQEVKRVVFLKDKADSYLKKSIGNCLGNLSIPKLLRKALDTLEITSIVAEQITGDESNLEHLERMLSDNLQGIFLNNFNYLKQQLRTQTVEFMYCKEEKVKENNLYIA